MSSPVTKSSPNLEIPNVALQSSIDEFIQTIDNLAFSHDDDGEIQQAILVF